MTWWNQAHLAVTRRRTRSLILALIIMLISAVFVLQGVMASMLTAVTRAAENQARPGFTVTSPAGDFRQEAATMLLATPHVTGHTFTLDTSAYTEDGGFQPVMGVSDLAGLQEFSRKEAELTEGAHDAVAQLRHGTGAVLADSAAAALNLAVGDELTLTKDEQSVTLRVAGLYQRTELARSGHELPIYTDLASAQHLAGKEAVSTATFYTDSRNHLEAAITQAKASLAQGLELGDSTSRAAGVLDSMAGMTTLLSRLLWVVLVAGAAILVLVLVFWTRSRLHEVGVLLAIGHSKRRVFVQFLTELTMLTIPSFLIALLISLGAGHVISRYVLGTVSATVGDVRVPVGALAAVGVLSLVAVLAIAAVSLLIAMTPLLRLQPKQILATMS